MAKNKILRIAFWVAGTFCVVLGMIGVIMPLLPTTPFLLMAVVFYAKSSKTFHRWITENRVFGAYVKNYYYKKSITLRIKVGITFLLWASIASSAVFAVNIYWVRLLLLLIAVGVTIHVWTLRTLK